MFASVIASVVVVIVDTILRDCHVSLYISFASLFPIDWNNTKIQAFLSGVPNDSMIILDLNSEQSPVWSSTESYFGKPFIWCLLHNYGGTRGIYGDLGVIGSSPVASRRTPGSTMLGVGMTPEAIEHNPVVYDLMVSVTDSF